MPTCYGLQLTVIASASLRIFKMSLIPSQSDLLFILSAGGVYSGSLGSTMTFASELFPVYASVTTFMTLYPQLLNMDYPVLILPPPKSMTKNMTKVKWTTYTRKLFTDRMRDAYRSRKLKAFHRSPEFRTTFANNISSEFHIDRLQRSDIIMDQDDCIRAAALQVLQSFRHLVTNTMPQAQVPSVAPVQPTVVPVAPSIVASTIVSSTHRFDAPVQRIVPTFTGISSSLVGTIGQLTCSIMQPDTCP